MSFPPGLYHLKNAYPASFDGLVALDDDQPGGFDHGRHGAIILSGLSGYRVAEFILVCIRRPANGSLAEFR